MAIIRLQIIGFHNCKGCSRKVRTAVRKIGVELVSFDRENGIVTVLSTADQNLEVIAYALERKLKKRVVLVSQDLMIPANQNPNSVANRGLHVLQDYQEIGQIVSNLAQLELDGVEITNTNTFRVNFNHRENNTTGVRELEIDDGYVDFAPPRLRSLPWVDAEPSAPPMEQGVVYGYGYPSEEFYGVSAPLNGHEWFHAMYILGLFIILMLYTWVLSCFQDL